MSGRGDDRLETPMAGSNYRNPGVHIHPSAIRDDAKAWECPVCHRGVRGDKDTCDHGGMSTLADAAKFLRETAPYVAPIAIGGEPQPWWANQWQVATDTLGSMTTVAPPRAQ